MARVTVSLALALFGAPLHAQVKPDSVKLRNDCRLAEQVLTTGQPATHRHEALSVIGLCGREGAGALVSVWSSVGADRSELGMLVTSTRAFVNQEIVDALFFTLNQQGRAIEVRVASLQVLLTFADPFVVPCLADFLGDSTQVLNRRYGRVDHPFPTIGRENLAEPLPDRLRTTLRTIAASDAEPLMRVAAMVALLNDPLR